LAFSDDERLNIDKFNDCKANTWDGKIVHFIGILSPPVNAEIWILNCQCVRDRFTHGQSFTNQWMQRFDSANFKPCRNDHCCSIACGTCFEAIPDGKKKDERYKCPFPCKSNVMYCTFNDPKRKAKIQAKIANDHRKCSECGKTQQEFMEKKPFCKPMNWTAVPNKPNEL